MKTRPTTLPGVVLVELDVFGDHRGRFIETFRRDRYRELGIGVGLEFVQDNFSSSARGILRGLHYQLTKPQGKLVHVTRGAVFDVAVDIRRGSPTFGTWYGQELTADNHLQMWVPPGFAHGFVSLTDDTYFSYKVTANYAPEDERSIMWNDPELAIAWPSDITPTLSKKDQAAPLLKDADLPTYAP